MKQPIHSPSWKTIGALLAAAAFTAGCIGANAKKANTNFFTSGNREADQRAEQRMAQSEQLAGSGEGSGEKTESKSATKSAQGAASTGGGTNQGAHVEGKTSLFERLGGQAGISNIIADFTPRALDDPRVNWERRGVKRGLFSGHGDAVQWNATTQTVATLEQHMVQFIALATGGPARYTGKDIKSVHADMHISNPEFDAVMGDLKASLDRLAIPNREQKELLAIVESTRPQIVTER